MKRKRVAVIDTTLLIRMRDAGVVEHLPLIFDEVRVPAAVIAEAGAARGRARQRMKNLFRSQGDFFMRCEDEDAMVRDYLRADLDAGESAVIAQAYALEASVIIDERAGSIRAKAMGLEVVRTGAILVRLKLDGFIESVAPYIAHLKRLGFHLSEKDMLEILRDAGE